MRKPAPDDRVAAGLAGGPLVLQAVDAAIARADAARRERGERALDPGLDLGAAQVRVGGAEVSNHSGGLSLMTLCLPRWMATGCQSGIDLTRALGMTTDSATLTAAPRSTRRSFPAADHDLIR